MKILWPDFEVLFSFTQQLRKILSILKIFLLKVRLIEKMRLILGLEIFFFLQMIFKGTIVENDK